MQLTTNKNNEHEQVNVVPECVPNIEVETIQNKPIQISEKTPILPNITTNESLLKVSRELNDPNITAASSVDNPPIRIETETIIRASDQLINQQTSIDNTRVLECETGKVVQDSSILKSFTVDERVRYKESNTLHEVEMIELQQNSLGISFQPSEHQQISLAGQNLVEIQPHHQTFVQPCKNIKLKPKEAECFELLLSIHNENDKNRFIAVDQIENRLNKNKVKIAMFLGQCQCKYKNNYIRLFDK